MPCVRKARHDDMEELVALLRLLFGIEEDFSFNETKQRQGLAMLLDSDRACVLVAEEESQIVGMCTGQLVISTAEGGPAVLVEDVVVGPDYQQQGIGRMLMASMVGWALEQGATRMQLVADRNNAPALAFYERIGWQATALICLRQYV